MLASASSMKLPLLAAGLVVLSCSVAHAAPAERVYVGVYLHDVVRFDQALALLDDDEMV